MLESKNPSYLASYTDFYTIHSFGIFFFPIDFQPDCRSLASLSEASIPSDRFSMSEEQAGGFKSVRLNPTRRSDCPAPGESIRSPGFSCDHWLLNWRCSFSTMIPGTAPRRHTSPPHSDASSQLITTVDGDKYASLCVSGLQGDVKWKVTLGEVFSAFTPGKTRAK